MPQPRAFRPCDTVVLLRSTLAAHRLVTPKPKRGCRLLQAYPCLVGFLARSRPPDGRQVSAGVRAFQHYYLVHEDLGNLPTQPAKPCGEEANRGTQKGHLTLSVLMRTSFASLHSLQIRNMAGAVRQPVDVDSLSTYLGHNVPTIKLPIRIKQACG